MVHQPLCFVLMPYGRKPVGAGYVDFDSVYSKLIRPAIEAAGMQPVRSDEEQLGGVIHKQMFERLILCEYAVADVTSINANVFYELGVRHAVRPKSTLVIFADGLTQLPYDIALMRAIPYQMDEAGHLGNVDGDRHLLTEKLVAARDSDADSPVFTLVDDYPDVDHAKTDLFRERVAYEQAGKEQLAAARATKDPEAVRLARAQLEPLAEREAALLIDLLLSFRAVSAWEDMISLVDDMPQHVQHLVIVQEQLGMALNRAGRPQDAEKVLQQVIQSHGPSSETNGLLGRVYKDLWNEARDAENKLAAAGYLSRAIDSYLSGFRADWRDAYPGINALTLLDHAGDRMEEFSELLPVVRFAVRQRLAGGTPDYWDHVTLMEIAVLEDDGAAARVHAGDALVAPDLEGWMPRTTADNLKIIAECREQTGRDATLIHELRQELYAAADRLSPSG